eukprot:GHVT01062632.1.p1 GENE.GHVT01062632.1~~GHVT01062632.1.p1  ORF type:complete len:516 (-),score=108.12 GHVT01062632.1:388-1725(-)
MGRRQQSKLQTANSAAATERKNIVEVTDTTTFNVNNLLRSNILASEYFKSLYGLKTYHEVVDEIFHYADHAEPYCSQSNRAPSTLFCCLYKFFTMRLTVNQMNELLEHADSPYIRCAGLLYLRYTHPPEKLWQWYEPYLLDDEEFTPGADKNKTSTIGEYIEGLLAEDKYFTTVLPRLPVKIRTAYGAQLIAIDEHRRRKKANKARVEEFTAGKKVDACSNGDWLQGEVVEVDSSLPGRTSVLVHLEDDSEECIDIGLVILCEKKAKRSKDAKSSSSRHHRDKYSSSSSSACSSSSSSSSSSQRRSRRSRSRSGSPTQSRESACPKTQEELVEEFKRRQREKALATGKDYARRPTSYKSALSARTVKASGRRSRSNSPSTTMDMRAARSPSPANTSGPHATQEASFEQKQRMAQLMQRYTKTNADAGHLNQNRRDVDEPDVLRLG